MVRPEDINAPLWRTMVAGLQGRAGDDELVPWENGGVAHLRPGHGCLDIDEIWLEPDVAHSESSLIYPVHHSGRFSVYEISGLFHVVQDETPWGKPFHTEDRALAVEVCNRWAQEWPS